MDIFVFVLIALLALSAFFSGIESAFISLGEIDLLEIENSNTQKGRILLGLLQNKEKLLSTILIGNNLVNIGASALNTTLAIQYAPRFEISEELSVTIATILLTLAILLFGEITPKSLAIVHKRKISLMVAPIILSLSWLFRPASFFMEKASNWITAFSTRGKEGAANPISETAVIHMVNKGEELGVINEREKSLIEKVFIFDEREVYPIMTPRNSVFALSEELTLEEAKEELMDKQFSRIPIYQESIDQITGVLNLKAAFKELLCGDSSKQLKELSQKALFIPETMTISALMERFQEDRNHIGFAVDEYGGMSGLITLEDILEELVGEIYDEKDKDAEDIIQLDKHKWEVAGRHDLVAINREINGEIQVDGDFESIQGLIMSHLERLPKIGDSIPHGAHQITVTKMRENKILCVEIEYFPEREENSEEGY